MAMDLARRYTQTAERSSYEEANRELQEIHDRLKVHDLNLCGTTEDLRSAARRCADRCIHARRQSRTAAHVFGACSQIAARYRVKPPSSKGSDLVPSLNRLCCPRWWFRKIQTLRLRTIEDIARRIDLVSRGRSAYASDYVVKLKRQQKRRNRAYLESTFVCNENGESFSLQALADRSVSNPEIRRAELMVRSRGFEMVANLLGHVGVFITLTVPSRMHARLHNGAANPRFDGTTTLQAHEYQTHLWALVRSELNRRGKRPYGFRVVEPHHDGTPHWHLLLFMPRAHCATVQQVIRGYALADNGNEPGAQSHRFKAVLIDLDLGTATGYIAKYIAKGIDGYALDQDQYGNDGREAAERITTWANTHDIRQFQQIGGPSVTVWRQLRRLEPVEDDELETVRKMVTASDWAAFTLAMGGVDVPRRDQAIKPFYDNSRKLNPTTGQPVVTLQGRYGDLSPLRAVGVIWKAVGYDTRKHLWALVDPASAPRVDRRTPRLGNSRTAEVRDDVGGPRAGGSPWADAGSHSPVQEKGPMARNDPLAQSPKRQNLHRHRGRNAMDTGQKGLTIRGNSVQIAFTYQGVRCRETVPMPPTKTALKELSLKRQSILYEIKTGTFDYAKHFPNSKRGKEFRKTRPDQYTIGEGLTAWLQRVRSKCERSTMRDYSSAIHYHLIPEFGHLPIADLSAIMVKEWLAGLPCSNKRKNNILTPLRQLYEDLYLGETIEKNPLERVKNFSVRTREPEPFTAEEIRKILDELEGPEKNLIQFAFWSGLRTSELIALCWEDVDMQQGRIFVRNAKVRGHLKGTKTASGSREVTLQPQAREALLSQCAYTAQLDGWVFNDSRTGEPWKNDQSIRKVVWMPALRKAGLKYRNPYQTRHTFASTLLSRGENPLWVAQQMGHKDWGQIRKVYGRWIASAS